MARTVNYGGNSLQIEDDSLTVAQIQASMADIFPELKNAVANVDGLTITFEVKAGTKGMARTVQYGGNELNIDDDTLTVEQIKASMSDIFPELKNAIAHVEGDIIKFEVKAGTKGARVVVYGGNSLNIDDDALTVAQIQASMSDIFPELKNATANVNGDTITFEVKAGTKGARTVNYGGNSLNIDDDTLTVAQIQASMSDIFPELKNATASVNGDVITFEVKAGTKGMKLVVNLVKGHVASVVLSK